MKTSDWISVKDRLPESPLLCICKIPSKHFGFCIRWLCKGSFEEAEKIYGKITHWMPIVIPEVKNDIDKKMKAHDLFKNQEDIIEKMGEHLANSLDIQEKEMPKFRISESPCSYCGGFEQTRYGIIYNCKNNCVLGLKKNEN